MDVQIGLLFWGVKATGGGTDLGGLGRRVIGVHYIKLLNNQFKKKGYKILILLESVYF